jgi:hypothetical protein
MAGSINYGSRGEAAINAILATGKINWRWIFKRFGYNIYNKQPQ